MQERHDPSKKLIQQHTLQVQQCENILRSINQNIHSITIEIDSIERAQLVSRTKSKGSSVSSLISDLQELLLEKAGYETQLTNLYILSFELFAAEP